MADAGSESAVRAGHEVLLTDDVGVAQQALGYELRMLHEIAGVADDSGDEDRALRQGNVLPDGPLVLVAGVGGPRWSRPAPSR